MTYIPHISIEGGDLTGKTTFQKALFPVIGKDLFVSDRNILTHVLYNEAFSRHKDKIKIWSDELFRYLTNNGTILLICSDKEIINRFKTIALWKWTGIYLFALVLVIYVLSFFSNRNSA